MIRNIRTVCTSTLNLNGLYISGPTLIRNIRTVCTSILNLNGPCISGQTLIRNLKTVCFTTRNLNGLYISGHTFIRNIRTVCTSVLNLNGPRDPKYKDRLYNQYWIQTFIIFRDILWSEIQGPFVQQYWIQWLYSGTCFDPKYKDRLYSNIEYKQWLYSGTGRVKVKVVAWVVCFAKFGFGCTSGYPELRSPCDNKPKQAALSTTQRSYL